MSYKRPLLGELLRARASLTDAQVAEALAQQPAKGMRIGEMLVHMKAVGWDDVYEALSEQLGVPFERRLPVNGNLSEDLVQKIPIKFAKRYFIFPLNSDLDDLQVVVADPLDCEATDALRSLLGAGRVTPRMARAQDIFDYINHVYDQYQEAAAEGIGEAEGGVEISDDDLEADIDILDSDDEAPIIRLINRVLMRAIRQRASDIHIEPFEKKATIRFRSDGVLYDVSTQPKRAQSHIISRVKIMANLNIAEKRLPQDGRIRIKLAGKDIDIRVSTVPTAFGERVVMRLLDKTSVLLDLPDVGLRGPMLKRFASVITRAHGIILVTGPTGSGKTTTLYAALSKINSPELNIITVEDPIEYQLAGVGQIQVNPKIELTFASGLRSILRQDPDVIMVGEIRDLETAEIAIQASLTGHLVFSTVHTNDAPGAITRLVDMGVEPFLVSSSIISILGQRLVRLLCEHCKESYTPTD
ncbi:MAG: Flp pilus assembly complex ATPase component TadA, partial [Candidatus Methylomirabilis sp.]|nr:Flp pilus assembly complex ATPase component TadA [Deltaproteobacteria bacterium]